MLNFNLTQRGEQKYMALFRQFRGKRTTLDSQELHDGYAYFCTDDGSFHIDYIDINGELKRKQINAKEAEVLSGYNISATLNSNDDEIPTSSAVISALTIDQEILNNMLKEVLV